MTKVYQTNTTSNNGDCARAAIASLFDLELNEVPDFISNNEKFSMGLAIMDFVDDRGYNSHYINNDESLKKIAKFDGGVNGFFYAIVKSQTYKGGLHAVIIDRELNVVHDPNPNEKCLNLNQIDIIQILTVNGFYKI